ncbi:tetratricopeptide repeat protein 21B-like [Anopheles ziemanni]|uniref:tetratricopeptide repeat protein 21B-like n=1 Tax=Anopheles coustani TaxID=139045 RepID=UPI002659D89A|nr:tetratricopeptide repeat protein 21B-like [Anopheles coustani]XP_058176098.1 tetratricopeptide repeat protein 21B-like [Anopheles ziemanni]
MDEHDYRSVIIYHARNRYYHTMQRTVLEAMAKYTSEVSFRFFNGLALVLDGIRIQEGIRELNQLRNDRDLGMAVTLCLMYTHKRCHIVDKEELISLDVKLKEERKRLTAQSAYYSALFLYLSGKTEKAKEYADKALRLKPDHGDVLSLKGWSELQLGNTSNHTLELFNRALESGGKHLDASLGQVRFHQLNSDFDTAIAVLNRLAVRFSESVIPLVEKMRTHLSNWHWEHTTEIANRILVEEPANLEALTVKIMVLLVKDGNYGAGVSALQYLASSLEKIEPANGELFLRLGQLYAAVCGRHPGILAETFKLVEKAVKVNGSNADYLTELGYQAILQRRYKEAVAYFKSATKVNDSSVYTLCGLTLCQMLEGGISDQVTQQLEFLTEIQDTSANPLLLFMTARLHADNSVRAIELLSAASEAHFKNLKALAYGPEYLRLFNPDFLLQLIRELLTHSPVKGVVSVGSSFAANGMLQQQHPVLLQAANLLESVVKACPGLVEAVYLLALVQRLGGEVAAASATLNRILQELDPAYPDAHLLLAEINIDQKQYQRAAQNLEICLSHSFKVRENPMYHLLYGIILKNQQQHEDALKSFMSALNLSGMNTGGTIGPGSNVKSSALGNLKLSSTDRLTLYLEMIGTHQQLNQSTEALKLLEHVSSEFGGTSEEGRLALAMADFYIQQGNHAKAIELLRKMQPDHQYYIQAKTKMAYIYLNHRKDRLTFAQCFRELVANCPNASSHLILGDAYMSIQEPDDAIDAYREALRQNPRDSLLASKLGRAYVRTHQYRKAITYYQEAIVNPENYPLKLDLAELYLKLKQYQNAEQTLADDVNDTRANMDDPTVLQMRTKQLLLLARIREKAGQLSASLQTLKEARDNQLKVQQRLLLDHTSGVATEQNKMLSKICVLMAEQSQAIRDNEQMIHHYKEALKYAQSDTVIMAALARVYMQLNRMDDCQATCAQIVQIDPNNEMALVMMADLSFRRMDFESAAYHFSQLLVNQPNYWTALARLIEVLRRSGTLPDAGGFLQRAEEEATRSDGEAGLSYCKGLYEWYRGNPNSALRLFNYCRRNAEWGQQAIYNMIEICLNPDGELPNEGSIADIGADDLEIKDSRAMALRTAERLLNELRPRPGVLDNEALNHRLLENFLLVASRQKYNVERALQNFTSIASQDEYREHIGVIYGMAATHVILKQGQRAKNQLKRVAKNVWTFEEAEYLEKCWLLLSDLYIQAGKCELATDLLKRVLQHNKSCTKAYELGGIAFEKEQNYRAAAAYYDSAWRYCGKSKPNIGYKLAFNHMKNKRYADAIDICQQVLKLHPDYPSIRKDILEKCRNNLKA